MLNKSKTIETIIGLLWTTGLWPSEPVKLVIADIDLEHCVLHIRMTKFSKERYVTFDRSVKHKLHEYKTWIECRLGNKSPKNQFFYTTGGEPLDERALAYAFQKIRPCINAKPADILMSDYLTSGTLWHVILYGNGPSKELMSIRISTYCLHIWDM